MTKNNMNIERPEDRIIDIFNKYKPLLVEYVDQITFNRVAIDEAYASTEDRKRVNDAKQRAKREDRNENYETHLQAEIFEGILIKHQKEIFGKDADIVTTSEYDDWINGVDMVLEGKDYYNNAVRIAIDAALSIDTRNVETKDTALLTKLETLDKFSAKESFLVKYFTRDPKKIPVKLHAVPSVVLGIASQNFAEIVNDVRGEKKNQIELRRILYTIIKQQLEKQFVFALGVSGEKADLRDQTNPVKKPDPQSTINVRKLYPLAVDVVEGGWQNEKIEELFSYFQKQHMFTFKEAYALKTYQKILSNIASAWEWARKQLLSAEAEAILVNNDIRDRWENNEVVQRLESHLDKERILKHHPFLAA